MKDIFDFNNAARQDTGKNEFAQPCKVVPFANSIERFKRFLEECGLQPGDNITPTRGERVERCPVTEDKSGQKSGWYVFFDDGLLPGGECGNWKTGEIWTWRVKEERLLTSEERKIANAQIERAKIMREEERTRLAEEAALRASSMWARAQECAEHPYLNAKRSASYGLRVLAGKLLIPVRDIAGTVRSLQQIDANGNKMFLFGGAISGGFYKIPGQSDVVAVAEGYATAASIHEATGWTVLCAFNAGNLLPVAREWRMANPADKMVICGDDDRFTKNGNTGRKSAEVCAQAIGAKVALPSFNTDENEPTDWNDLHVLAGLEETRRQLLDAVSSYKITVENWTITPEMFSIAPEPRRDLVENTFPMGSVILLASLGGIGKSMKMLDLALLVAGQEENAGNMDFNPEPRFFGNRVVEHGPVVIYTAEDAHRDNCDRIFKMGRKFPKYPVSVIPIIDVVGAYPLILPGDRSGPVTSPMWDEMRNQMIRLKPSLIVFDPLSSFAMLDLNKPEWATFAIGMFSNLASETGACIIVTHHLAKTKENISTPEQARALVRGSTAIVDRTRGTYVLWGMAEKQAKKVCEALGEEWVRDKVVQGCLAKENFGGDKTIKTFVRKKNGLLVVRNDDLQQAASKNIPDIMSCLELAIADAAKRGQPFTKTGVNGLYERRQELPALLQGVAKNKFEKYVQELLDSKKIVTCISKGSTSKKWLDVPDGDFALGVGQIIQGAAEDVQHE